MSGVAVREYASAEEMLAAYRARLRPPANIVRIPVAKVPEPEPAPVEVEAAPEPVDDLALYREAFESAIPPENPYRVAKGIIKTVSDETRVSIEQIRSKLRPAPIAAARQECMYRIARDTALSVSQIGRIFDRDHTTVIHALHKMGEIHGVPARTGCRQPSALLAWRLAKEAAAKAGGQP